MWSVVLYALPVKLMYLLPSFRYLILNILSQSLQRDFLTKQDLILAEKFIDAVDFTHHHTVFRIIVAPRMPSISVQTRIIQVKLLNMQEGRVIDKCADSNNHECERTQNFASLKIAIAK